MRWLSVFFLAIAVSFDALAIGITYSLNEIRIPLRSKSILSLVSGCTFLIALLGGMQLEKHLNSYNTGLLGGIIFIFLGLYNLWRNYRPEKTSPILLQWRIPVLGLIVQVFQEPLKADADDSKHITGPEAFILGGVLALDSIAAGFGAAVLGLPPIATTLSIAIASLLFISWGLHLGIRLKDSKTPRLDWRWVPGTIIIVLGISKIIF